MDLEPVGEDPEGKQEDGKTEQHHCGHDAHRIPDFSSSVCNEAVERQAGNNALGEHHNTNHRRRTFFERRLRVSGERAP